MLIGIDGNEANIESRVGIGEYAYRLLSELVRIYSSTDTRLNIYLKHAPLPHMPEETNGLKYDIFGPKVLWTRFALPFHLLAQKNKPNVIFSPNHYSPRYTKIPKVVSVMDLSYIYYPKMFKKKDHWQLKNWTGYSIANAAHILTISRFTKKSIVEYYNIDESMITVTYPGYDRSLYRLPQGEDMRIAAEYLKGFGIEGDYILFVGTLQPRKNLIRLLEAFSLVLRSKPGLNLVIIGQKGWLYDEIFRKVESLGISDKVVFPGFVPLDRLRYFYFLARAFVFPSLYEGFGIPLLEAMASGCPVIASQISSIPEVVGNAGILIDPYNTLDIAGAINNILDNTARRERLVEEGVKRVKFFSWKKCAEETSSLLNMYK